MFETLEILLDLNYSGLQRKIESSVGGIEKAFKKIDKEFDWGKIMNANYFKSVNWTSLIGMLFTPANLITFFAAMGALGLTTAMGLQSQVTTSPVGATLSDSDRQIFTDAAKSIAQSTGQSSSDVVDAMSALFPAMGDNVDATVKLTQLLAEAAAATGQNVKDVGQPFAGLLQTLGVSDLGTASDLLTAITNGANQAGISVQSFIQAFGQFAPEVANAHLSVSGLIDVFRQFGASIQGAGLQGATEAFNTLFKSLTSSDPSAIALANLSGGVQKLKSLIDDGKTSGALDAVGASVENLAQHGQLSMLANEFGVSAAGLDAFDGKVTKFHEADLKSIQELFDSTATSARGLAQAWETLKNESSDVFGGPLMIALNAILGLFTAIIGAFDIFKQDVEGMFKDPVNFGLSDPLSKNGGSNAVSTPATGPNISNTFNFSISGGGQAVNNANTVLKTLGNQNNNLAPGAGGNPTPRMSITSPFITP